MYENFRTNLNVRGDNGVREYTAEDSPLGKEKNVYSEIEDIFPALQKYKNEHTIANLQKLLAEILEFCTSVYASTQNEKEREVYRTMISKLNK